MMEIRESLPMDSKPRQINGYPWLPNAIRLPRETVMARDRQSEPELSSRRAEPRLYRYVIDTVWEVLAGRTDADNDRLSLKIAQPNDWWFHLSGHPGSHVVLRVPDGETPSREVLKQAAAIAAWHSKARAGGTVTVTGTLAKYVTKPRGAQPGTVSVRREATFKVKPGLPAGSTDTD
jgi:predicted ribosome quality control (RQC) complex YloA/Tae2 family protein